VELPCYIAALSSLENAGMRTVFSVCSYLDQGRLKCSCRQDVSVPANVEQIIIHCNCTSISFRDAEWAAYSPWISAQVKNLYVRYHVASIIPSHSIQGIPQDSYRVGQWDPLLTLILGSSAQKPSLGSYLSADLLEYLKLLGYSCWLVQAHPLLEEKLGFFSQIQQWDLAQIN